MVEISPEVREQLKIPLGRFVDAAALRSQRCRIISIGDVCTLGLLESGIMPHLAVFDFRSMRHELEPAMVRALRSAFRNPVRYQNPPGTLSDEILRDAPALIKKGGAILIDGEEDLTALAFILAASGDDVVIYGQPNEGLVLVRPDENIKRKIKGWLSCPGS
jgi:GTP-dependent dephospho-CoA kinase